MDEPYLMILYIAFALYTLLLGIAAFFDKRPAPWAKG